MRKLFILLYFLQISYGQSSENSTITRRAIVPIANFYQPPSQPSNLNQFQYPNTAFYNYAYSTPLVQFFGHIQPPNYPDEIIEASQRVSTYLINSPINANNIIQMVNGIGGLNPMDRLVAFLLRIQGELPLDCSIKSDVSTLILYNMMKSYLNYVPVLQTAIPYNMDMYMAPSDEALRYREIIKILLNKLKCCQNKVQSLQQQLSMSQNRMNDWSTSSPEIQVRIMEPMTTPAPEVVTQIKYIEIPCPTPPPCPTMALTPPTTTISPYLAYVDVVPKPNNSFERMKYGKIIAMLQRKDLNGMLGALDLTAGATDLSRLNIILRAAANLQLEQGTLDAIRYYLSIAKSAAALNLSMQKEIKKQFELTKIFTATFDFEALSMKTKGSFDSFYNFLLGVTGDQMHSFTTWTEAHTKGEFMKVLFEYFLNQDFTPVEVKEAINDLLPFILMVGEGADPI